MGNSDLKVIPTKNSYKLSMNGYYYIRKFVNWDFFNFYTRFANNYGQEAIRLLKLTREGKKN